MKNHEQHKGQLNIFSKENIKRSSTDISNAPSKQGKQVFLNSRQEIYNKILNRKME